VSAERPIAIVGAGISGLAAAIAFLGLNGLWLEVDPEELVDAVMRVAAGAMPKAELAEFIDAPVADVPSTPANFLQAQRRAFSTSRFTVATDTAAFAQGIEAGRVQPAYKHFPGLGRAGVVSTDEGLVEIGASRRQITRGLLPYQVARRRSLHPVVMLSTAVYPAYSPRAAAWSKAIAGTLLRHDLGFKGPTITDSLTTAAAVRRTGVSVLAVKSAKVGVDLLLITGPASTSRAAYAAVLREARSGVIRPASLKASYARILKLKSRF